MTALIVLGAVAAFFALLLLLPVGADVAFDEGGPQVALRLGPVRLQVLPAKPKKAHVSRKNRRRNGKLRDIWWLQPPLSGRMVTSELRC